MQVNLTELELQHIKAKAAELSYTPSEYIRSLILKDMWRGTDC